jgi:hypothetical protein
MKKGYKLATFDKNVLLKLKAHGGEATAGDLYRETKPEFNFNIFCAYLKGFAKSSGAVSLQADSVQENTIVNMDIEVFANLIAW